MLLSTTPPPTGGRLAMLADACLAANPPPPDAVADLCDALSTDPASAHEIPPALCPPLMRALLTAPRAIRIEALAALKTLTRLPQGTEPLASPDALSILSADVARLARFSSDTPHDWAICDSALRTINNVLLIHEDLRGPFSDPGPLPGIGGAQHVLATVSPVASLLQSIFFPLQSDPLIVAQHNEMLQSCMKPHAPGPRGATSALDAVFLSARVLFLSTLFRLRFNTQLVHELDGLSSLRNMLSVLARIRHDLQLQAEPHPVIVKMVDDGLRELLRLRFNVSLYCPPEAPYLETWAEILAIIVHLVTDTVTPPHAAQRPHSPRDTLPTASALATSPSPPSSFAYAPSDTSRSSHWTGSTPCSSFSALDGPHHDPPLSPLLTNAINVLLNFPLGAMDDAWRFPAEWDPMSVPSGAWRPASPVRHTRPTTSSVTDEQDTKGGGTVDRDPRRCRPSSLSSSAARKLAASLFSRAKHAHSHGPRTRRALNPFLSSDPAAPSSDTATGKGTGGPDNGAVTGTVTVTGPGTGTGTSTLLSPNTGVLQEGREPEEPTPALVSAVLLLLERSLVRYFIPAGSDVTSSKSEGGDAALTLEVNERAAELDGVENVEEKVTSILTLLRKLMVEEEGGGISVRARVRNYLFPRGLDRTVRLSARTDFRGILLRLLADATLPDLMAASGALMLSVFDEDPQLMTKELGYGPSIGFLIQVGLAGKIASTPQRSSSFSTPPDNWDPFTATLQSPEQGVAGTGMTEAEAKVEATRLLGMMERLNRPPGPGERVPSERERKQDEDQDQDRARARAREGERVSPPTPRVSASTLATLSSGRGSVRTESDSESASVTTASLDRAEATAQVS